jgi:predicted PurR-regulated permease PerM
MNLLPSQQRAGPVVWSGIIGATCAAVPAAADAVPGDPFLLGIVLYYILQPPMQRLIRMGMSHNAAALAVGFAFFVVVGLLILLAVFWNSTPSDSWQDMLGIYMTGGLDFVRHTMQSLEQQFPLLKKMKLAKTVNIRVTAFTGSFVQKHLTDILVSVAAWLPSLLLAPFLAFFFLRDGLRFKKFLARAVPNAFFEKTLCLLHEVDQTAHRYFQGLIKLTILDTAVLALGLWVIGVSSPLVLGLIAALAGVGAVCRLHRRLRAGGDGGLDRRAQRSIDGLPGDRRVHPGAAAGRFRLHAADPRDAACTSIR